MIVPMKKISLIVLDSEREDALIKLRKLGLVHIEIKEGKGPRLVQLKLRVDLRKRSDVPNGWSLSLHRSGFFLEFEGILPSRVHPTPTDFQISDLLQDSFLLEIKRRTVGKQWFGAEL